MCLLTALDPTSDTNVTTWVFFYNSFIFLHSTGVHTRFHIQTGSKSHSHTLTQLLFSHSSNHSQAHSLIIQSHSCIPNIQSLNQSDLLHSLATLSTTHIHAQHAHTTYNQSQRETRTLFVHTAGAGGSRTPDPQRGVSRPGRHTPLTYKINNNLLPRYYGGKMTKSLGPVILSIT